MRTLPTLSFTEALRLGWKNKFKCAGRARRSEFWWNVLQLGFILAGGSLFVSIISLIYSVITGYIDTEERIVVFFG